MSLVGFKITNHPQQVGKRGASDSVDERITPASVYEPLREEFKFDLDVAANARNSKTHIFYSKTSPFGCGLTRKWGGRVWCNPPYSDIRAWVEKAWAEHRSGSCEVIAMLLPANRCEQGWWQDLIEPFRDGRGPLETRFYRGRFNFGLPDNPEGKFHSSPPFGCVLVIWRNAIAAGSHERWRPIAGYEGLYEVSDLGRVRSRHFDPPKLLKFGRDETGYPTVMLSKGGPIRSGGTRKPMTVHRLVATAFHSENQNALHCEVAHLDGDRTNARADNLKWVSKVENESHKRKHGTSQIGEGNGFSRLKEADVLRIRTRYASSREIAADYAISRHTVFDIWQRVSWRHLPQCEASQSGAESASPNPSGHPATPMVKHHD